MTCRSGVGLMNVHNSSDFFVVINAEGRLLLKV